MDQFKEMLAKGDAPIGTWVTLSDTLGVEALGGVGFDWLVFDLEHTGITPRELLVMCQCISRFSTIPLVRIRGLVESEVKAAWAAGAAGIMSPNIMTRGAAETLIEWCKYPPQGMRGVGGARSWGPANGSADAALNDRNNHALVAIQIEHVDAVGRLDDILSVEGIDVCYVGLDDLYASMGIGQSNDKGVSVVDDVLKQILEVSSRHNVAPGIHSNTAQALVDRRNEGWRFLGLGEDIDFMYRSAQAELAGAR